MTNENKAEKLKEDLQNALDRLEEALLLEETEITKDASIQRFEFCFELSWKLMQACVRSEGLEAASPKESIRLAAQIKLIENPEEWFEFLKARNLTTHTYDTVTADNVYESAKKFLPQARKILSQVTPATSPAL